MGKKKLLPLFVAAGVLIPVFAQTVMKFPEKRQSSPSEDNAAMTKVKAFPIVSDLSLASAQDQKVAQAWIESNGALPEMPALSPSAQADETVWTYSGFNAAAGTSATGNTTGGMVNFNLDPFVCDTVSSDPGLSSYSVVIGDYLHCFLPNLDRASGLYTSYTRSIYDANTFEFLESDLIELPDCDKSYIPYLLSYDDQKAVTYCVSMGNEGSGSSGDSYYLNIYNPDSGKLQRLGYLGSWVSGRDDKDQYAVKGFVCGYGTLYVQLNKEAIYIGKINPVTCETTVIGRTDMPNNGLFGLQPMIYDSNKGVFLVNHYDFYNGTVYYNVSTWATAEGTINTTKLESAPTGFTFFYKRPENIRKSYTYLMEQVSDLEITPNEDCTSLTVTFTAPKRLADGSEISYPSWVQEYQKGVRAALNIDGAYFNIEGLPNPIRYGQKVSGTVDIANGYVKIDKGLHVYTLSLTSLYNELGIDKVSTIAMLGDDAPGRVRNVTAELDGDNVNLRWEVPVESQYADFGTEVDLSKVTYSIVRNDGKIVAEGITETSFTDKIEAEEYKGYVYTIYASIGDRRGPGSESAKLNAGKYMPLPYFTDFGSSDCLDSWWKPEYVLYLTWNFNNYGKVLTTNWGLADYWIFTPPFYFEKNKVYELASSIEGLGLLEIAVSKDTDVESCVVVGSLEKGNKEGDYLYFSPEEDGYYRFALHNYSSSDETNHWSLHDFAVKEVATSGAPAAPTALVFKADPYGQPSGKIELTLPSKSVNGGSVGKISSVKVYDGKGKEVGSLSNPGSNPAIAVSVEGGFNTFKVVAVNEAGEGYPAVLKTFVGPDVPKALNGVDAVWGDASNKVVLKWDAADETGVNGGYVDTDNVEYVVYKYDPSSYPAETELGRTPDNEIEVQILDNDKQDQYIFALTVVGPEGESEQKRVGIVLGKPYSMPIEEKLDQSGLTVSPWIIMNVEGDNLIAVDGGFYNENVTPKIGTNQIVFGSKDSHASSGRFVTPIIDFKGAQQPVLNLWVNHAEGLSADTWIGIDATLTGGRQYDQLGERVSLAGGNGWQMHTFDLSALKDKKAQVGIHVYAADPKDRVFVDWISIKEAAGSDLALTGISQTRYEKTGDKTDIAVTVANVGKNAISDYTVMFYVDGEVVAEEIVDKTLAPAQERVFRFPLELNAGTNGRLRYYAEVSCDDDENENNNISEVRTINTVGLQLPAPTDLTLDDNRLSWSAPSVVNGVEKVLDFEDIPAFVTNDIDGWTTIDGDGHATTSFVQYYGNYWPYANQPLAWMTWGTKDAGCAQAAMWGAYEGDRCLIAWGNWGADADGRDNSAEPEDDWFISPEIVGGSELSFRAYAQETGCEVEIMYSTTDRKPESFSLIKNVDFKRSQRWVENTVTLPADAKYVALHVVKNSFGILVDNIRYTEAINLVFKGYNVYRNAVSSIFTENTFADTFGDGMYGVSALYDLGESELSNIADLNDVDKIEVEGGAIVEGGKGFVAIYGADGCHVTVSDIAGVLVFSGKVADEVKIPAAHGIYAVKAGDRICKVIVK